MTKIAKLLTVAAIVITTGTFFMLNSSNEIICGNIEALTGGDNDAPWPLETAYIMTKGRKATNQECEDSRRPILGITLPNGFTENSSGVHNIVGDYYYDCSTYSYGFVVFDNNYGECVAWSSSNNPATAMFVTCNQHP